MMDHELLVWNPNIINSSFCQYDDMKYRYNQELRMHTQIILTAKISES